MVTIWERLSQSRALSNRAVFNAIMPQVLDVLARGETNRKVYNLLVAEGTLQCSYNTFCWYVRKAQKSKKSFTPEERGMAAKPLPPVEPLKPPAVKDQPAAPQQASAVIGGFTFERKGREDLI